MSKGNQAKVGVYIIEQRVGHGGDMTLVGVYSTRKRAENAVQRAITTHREVYGSNNSAAVAALVMLTTSMRYAWLNEDE